jgi:hypothetical protein
VKPSQKFPEKIGANAEKRIDKLGYNPVKYCFVRRGLIAPAE